MRCPKCGFHSFDYLDTCKKCNEDLRPYKAGKETASTVASHLLTPTSAASPTSPGLEPPLPSPSVVPFAIPAGINLEEPKTGSPPPAVKPPTSALSPEPLPLDLDSGFLEETKPEAFLSPSSTTTTPTPKVPEFTLDFGSPKAGGAPRMEPPPAVAPPLDLVTPPPSPKPFPLISSPMPMAPPAEHLSWDKPTPAAATLLSNPRGGFWIRFAAQMVDGTILTFILTLVFIILFFALGLEQMLPRPGQGPENIKEAVGSFIFIQVIFNVLSIVFSAAYFIYFHGSRGQTPGKMLFKLKVIQENGQEMTYGKSLIRFLGYIVNQFTLLIGFLWAAFDREKQGLHDKIAKTLVVRLG